MVIWLFIHVHSGCLKAQLIFFLFWLLRNTLLLTTWPAAKLQPAYLELDAKPSPEAFLFN